ncbi:MAG: peptidoglycan DD-metalloendopeptidase family protein [Desulfohalobiaceae bacterium]|nr:peptidoglycan DD-metalloendopeptidase family protein [Desulfohalobiaceae bacterium]
MRKNRRYGARFDLKLLAGGKLLYLQAALAAFAVVLGVVFLINNVFLDNTRASIEQAQSGTGLSLEQGKGLLDQKSEQDAAPADSQRPGLPGKDLQVVETRVQTGQTASDILSGYLSAGDIHYLARECREVFPLHKIRSGNSYRLYLKDKALAGLEYDIDGDEKLCIGFDQGSYAVSKEKIAYQIKRHLVEGTISSSLFAAVKEAGEKDQLALALADIFAWDIDFIFDIREGDSFRLIVEKRYRDKEFAGYGDILAARFVNQGHVFQAFLFALENGREEYFDARGQAMRKSFLKAPLNFSRISSGYTLRRMHPILKKVRPHQGIDYAAPSGTPVKTVGDGKIVAKGYQRNGGGRYLKIRHPNSYQTTYMHLSRFAKGMRTGKRVTQGEVIGYVGSSGLSTGPHLDFRVKKHGQYVNPLKVESTPTDPVPKAERDRFFQEIKPLLAVLEGFRPLYAEAEPSKSTD